MRAEQLTSCIHSQSSDVELTPFAHAFPSMTFDSRQTTTKKLQTCVAVTVMNIRYGMLAVSCEETSTEARNVRQMLPPVCTFLTPAPPHVSASSIRYPLSIRDQHDPDIVWIYPCPSKLYPIHCPTSGKIAEHIIEHMRQRLPSYPIEKASLQTICNSQPSAFPSNSRYYSHGYVSSISRHASLQSGGYQIAFETRLSHDFQSNHVGNLFRRNYATRFPIQQHQMPNPASPCNHLLSNVSTQPFETVGTVTQCSQQTDSAMPCTLSNGASTRCLQSCDVPYCQSVATSYRLMLPYPRYSLRSSCALHSTIQATTNSADAYVEFEGCPVYAQRAFPCACNQNDAGLIQSSYLASSFGVFETESVIYSSEKSNEHKSRNSPGSCCRQTKRCTLVKGWCPCMRAKLLFETF